MRTGPEYEHIAMLFSVRTPSFLIQRKNHECEDFTAEDDDDDDDDDDNEDVSQIE
jgi:hypothetical protein